MQSTLLSQCTTLDSITTISFRQILRATVHALRLDRSNPTHRDSNPGASRTRNGAPLLHRGAPAPADRGARLQGEAGVSGGPPRVRQDPAADPQRRAVGEGGLLCLRLDR